MDAPDQPTDQSKKMTLPSNYTDEEIFALLELQLGKPPATQPPRSPFQQPVDNGEGEYYNAITEWLFRMLGPGDTLIRMRGLRERFYRQHNIIAFDVTTLPEKEHWMKQRADGSSEFNSPGFDNSKRLK